MIGNGALAGQCGIRKLSREGSPWTASQSTENCSCPGGRRQNKTLRKRLDIASLAGGDGVESRLEPGKW